MSEHRTRVVVIGGGYAGVIAANHLRLRPDVDITLVNPRPDFVERIRLHQRVTGSGRRAGLLRRDPGSRHRTRRRRRHPHRPADRRGVAVRRRAAALRLSDLRRGQRIGTVRHPGVDEFAYPIAELEQAQRLGAALDDLHHGAPVCVRWARVPPASRPRRNSPSRAASSPWCADRCSGRTCPPAVAARWPAVAQARRRDRRRAGRDGHRRRRRRGDPAGRQAAAELRDDLDRRVRRSGPGRRSGLRTDAVGRLLTDETLTSVDDERIVAAGDAATPSDEPLRMSCQAAIPLGAQAANTVLARIAGDRPSRSTRPSPASASASAPRRGHHPAGAQERHRDAVSTSAAGPQRS